MTSIIPFRKEHLEVMDMRDHEKAVLSLSKDLSFLEMGVAVTALVDGRIVCCGGIVPLSEHTANIWMLPSNYVHQYRRKFMTELKEWLLETREEMKLTRMQSICLNDQLHDSWMEYLGFDKEGVLKKYYIVDYAIWGRTWE